MESSLPNFLIILGALSAISVQTQKIAILESKNKPTAMVNGIVSAALQFSNFVMLLGIVLSVLQQQNALPEQVGLYESYILAGVGAVFAILAITILMQKNVSGKVGSVQLLIIAIIAIVYGVKEIVEEKD